MSEKISSDPRDYTYIYEPGKVTVRDHTNFMVQQGYYEKVSDNRRSKERRN